MAQCSGIKRDGGRCTVSVAGASEFCHLHDPRRAEERRRNASKAGRSRPNREIRHLKGRLRDIAEDTLSGALDPRRAAVAVQAYNAVVRALEQERRIVEQEVIMERLERLEARRGIAS
jgi:hypothetical protein